MIRSWKRGPQLRRAWRAGVPALILAGMTACGLLDVTDPTLVQDGDIANAAGANARRQGVMDQVNQNWGYLVREVGLFTDERTRDFDPFSVQLDREYYLDLRDGDQYERVQASGTDLHLGFLDETITKSSIAIPAVRAYTPDSLRGDFLAQLYALRGFAIVQMAEDLCPGFPINDVKDNLPVYSEPYTTDDALAYGIAEADSALAHGQDSTDFLSLARVVKGRALLDLGQYAEAAATVAEVPTFFSYATTNDLASNSLFEDNWPYEGYSRVAVSDVEGGVGLPFVSAQDPRVPTVFRLTRVSDSGDSLFDQLKYPAYNTPVVLAGGIEARLIEAEAALAVGSPAWLTTLNMLRTTAITPAMDTISNVPSTPEAEVDLLYRERAFWLYLTGRRLGDVRRLIHNYGRAPETVLPTGAYPVGGLTFRSSTSIPFVLANAQLTNPHITAGCTAR
jgi:hypothetical protein